VLGQVAGVAERDERVVAEEFPGARVHDEGDGHRRRESDRGGRGAPRQREGITLGRRPLDESVCYTSLDGMMTHGADPMSERRRPWRGADADLFRFTTTDLRELHIALMSAFEEAAVLVPALNLDQVRSALSSIGWDERVADEALQRALAALVGWGLLEATQDHAAHYATPEEFERKNLQWSLTQRGGAAIAGLLHSLDALRRAVGLQPAVLDAIGDGLSDLGNLLSGERSTELDARIHIRLAEVEGHHASLIESVRQFNGHLQRLVREDATQDNVFIDVNRRTIAYLEEYVDDVERRRQRVALDRALAGANLAPVASDDPAPAWLAERRRRWAGLLGWFAPTGGAKPLLTGLLGIARTAIIELLRALERRWDNRRRSASVAHDFRRLAAWFANVPGDSDAHRLFAAAFGLWPARHAHLRPVDGEARAPMVSWSASQPVEVAPALRTSGTLSNRGRVHPVRDPAEVRAQRRAAQVDALAAHDTVRASLITEGLVRLSSFGRMPSERFAELLALLGAALDAPLDAVGKRRALSTDGRIEVVVEDPGDGKTITLDTDHGALHGPDLFVWIRSQ
jgi:uncharacterized protein (TIGR02677 family)